MDEFARKVDELYVVRGQTSNNFTLANFKSRCVDLDDEVKAYMEYYYPTRIGQYSGAADPGVRENADFVSVERFKGPNVGSYWLREVQEGTLSEQTKAMTDYVFMSYLKDVPSVPARRVWPYTTQCVTGAVDWVVNRDYVEPTSLKRYVHGIYAWPVEGVSSTVFFYASIGVFVRKPDRQPNVMYDGYPIANHGVAMCVKKVGSEIKDVYILDSNLEAMADVCDLDAYPRDSYHHLFKVMDLFHGGKDVRYHFVPNAVLRSHYDDPQDALMFFKISRYSCDTMSHLLMAKFLRNKPIVGVKLDVEEVVKMQAIYRGLLKHHVSTSKDHRLDFCLADRALIPELYRAGFYLPSHVYLFAKPIPPNKPVFEVMCVIKRGADRPRCVSGPPPANPSTDGDRFYPNVPFDPLAGIGIGGAKAEIVRSLLTQELAESPGSTSGATAFYRANDFEHNFDKYPDFFSLRQLCECPDVPESERAALCGPKDRQAIRRSNAVVLRAVNDASRYSLLHKNYRQLRAARVERNTASAADFDRILRPLYPSEQITLMDYVFLKYMRKVLDGMAYEVNIWPYMFGANKSSVLDRQWIVNREVLTESTQDLFLASIDSYISDLPSDPEYKGQPRFFFAQMRLPSGKLVMLVFVASKCVVKTLYVIAPYREFECANLGHFVGGEVYAQLRGLLTGVNRMQTTTEATLIQLVGAKEEAMILRKLENKSLPDAIAFRAICGACPDLLCYVALDRFVDAASFDFVKERGKGCFVKMAEMLNLTRGLYIWHNEIGDGRPDFSYAEAVLMDGLPKLGFRLLHSFVYSPYSKWSSKRPVPYFEVLDEQKTRGLVLPRNFANEGARYDRYVRREMSLDMSHTGRPILLQRPINAYVFAEVAKAEEEADEHQ